MPPSEMLADPVMGPSFSFPRYDLRFFGRGRVRGHRWSSGIGDYGIRSCEVKVHTRDIKQQICTSKSLENIAIVMTSVVPAVRLTNMSCNASFLTPIPAGMNTLADHGYIPRNGIATFEEITLAMVEAYNLEINFGAFLVAANMVMARVAARESLREQNIDRRVSPLVPPLPGNIGSNVTGGLAKHGGFEGDASITRADVHIGDNRNFQDILYDLDLLVPSLLYRSVCHC
ncbi:hypothetical protein DFH09DRAFT_1278988 [Mycena vulgaris]|nr:hypothetical protein DFH09DRAFT_1278988 [Mycena vulgaris]